MSFRALISRLKPLEKRSLAQYTRNFATNEDLGPKKDDEIMMNLFPDEVANPRTPVKTQLKPVEKAKHSYIVVREVEELNLVSGIPEEHVKGRKVCISQPSKNAMQSGTNNINYWHIDFDTRERWENPLMGWCSTGDPNSNLQVDFNTLDDAILHCKKMGYDYYIQQPNPVGPKPRSYGQNFAWNKRTRVTTK